MHTLGALRVASQTSLKFVMLEAIVALLMQLKYNATQIVRHGCRAQGFP